MTRRNNGANIDQCLAFRNFNTVYRTRRSRTGGTYKESTLRWRSILRTRETTQHLRDAC
jgi:hypothetical protein